MIQEVKGLKHAVEQWAGITPTDSLRMIYVAHDTVG